MRSAIPFFILTAAVAAGGCASRGPATKAGSPAPSPAQAQASSPTSGRAVTDKVFYVYQDKGLPVNHYAPSGWMGDTGDLRLDDGSKENPVGATAIKITYSAKGSKGAGWAGIYWQHPPNNWGSRQGGFDLSVYRKLTFQARGAQGGEKAEFKMGGITGEFGDSDAAASAPIELSKGWRTYSIDLEGKDLSRIVGGFCWVANRDDNPDGATFFIDEVRYEQ